MKWDKIRAHYVVLLNASGRTQEAVARAGRLPGQNAISKLIRTRKRGPSVETFARAVHGLGLTLAAFFAGLDDADKSTPSMAVRLAALERTLAHLQHGRFPVAVGGGVTKGSTHGETLSVALVGTQKDHAFVSALVSEAVNRALAEVAASHGLVLPGIVITPLDGLGPPLGAGRPDDSTPTRRGRASRRGHEGTDRQPGSGV